MTGRRANFNNGYIDKKDNVNDNDVNYNDVNDYAMSDREPVYQYPLSAIGYPKLQRSQTYQRRKVKLSDYGYLNNEDVIAKAIKSKQQHAAVVKSKNGKQSPWSSTIEPVQVTNHIVRGEMEKHGEKFHEGLSNNLIQIMYLMYLLKRRKSFE